MEELLERILPRTLGPLSPADIAFQEAFIRQSKGILTAWQNYLDEKKKEAQTGATPAKQ